MTRLPFILAAALAGNGAPAFGEIPGSLVQELKPTVVNIEISVQHGLNTEGTGVNKGTGFIVDAERGIIATNRHVVGTSPGRIKIVFEDGRTAEARHWHYDNWHDFAFIRLDKTDEDLQLQAVRLGDSWKLTEQQDVLLIGNNDAQEYSVKFGKTANLHLCKGQRHSATIQTTFDRAGGSSGSPVFNADGEVVGIHFAGSDSTSFEMRVEYLADALRQLTRTGSVRRGDIGVALDTMLISDAKKHFRLPDEAAYKVAALRDDIKRMVYVEYVAPMSPAEGHIQAGDLVLEVEKEWLGDDVYRFDKLVDSRVGRKVSLTVVRGGKVRDVRLPVQDAEKDKVRSFVLFAGGVLHDVTPYQRLSYNLVGEGVFLTQAEKGSSFADLGREGSHTKYLLLIEGVNGVPTPSLERFIEVVRDFRDGDRIYVLVQDRWRTQSITRAHPVRLDLKYFPLRVFDWSEADLEWVPREG
ncbi:MAG: trypsin-like peptidase domain-containing protein [Elusimicrobiota bacterium]